MRASVEFKFATALFVALLPGAPTLAATKPPTPLETPDPALMPATADWLVGIWLLSATSDDLDRLACNSGTVTNYLANGTTQFFGGQGTWRLDGDRLRERITDINEAGDPSWLGEKTDVRIRRVGPDEGAALSGDKWVAMLRCRPGDIR